MEPFFPALSDELISSDFLKKTGEKYHFGEEQTPQLKAVAKEMLPSIREEAFWTRRDYFPEEPLSQNADATYECAAMSLGNGIDLLQERYSEKGLLLQSYMVEALASELLLRGYDAYNRFVAAHTAKHVARYHFPGNEDRLPLEMLPDLLKNLTPKIACNAACCMQPKKSVVFIAELTTDESVHCEGICAGCSRIFGVHM
ncbi:MAG: hypothetical protein NC302_03160 [Bacteroidales bacterium]|nr:hypothetical protein [Bacteroidales bacterium]MCM1414912.1 hypothetical protein [bacterium]MCM1423061.1 hypothetical protein [bacterium]